MEEEEKEEVSISKFCALRSLLPLTCRVRVLHVHARYWGHTDVMRANGRENKGMVVWGGRGVARIYSFENI